MEDAQANITHARCEKKRGFFEQKKKFLLDVLSPVHIIDVRKCRREWSLSVTQVTVFSFLRWRREGLGEEAREIVGEYDKMIDLRDEGLPKRGIYVNSWGHAWGGLFEITKLHRRNFVFIQLFRYNKKKIPQIVLKDLINQGRTLLRWERKECFLN